jgi:ubiquinone/menaquinone biosynthesis C-methylase UbiE
MSKLYLGCGGIRKNGWINIDVDPSVFPDVVSPAEDLAAFGAASVEVIESHHLFEHFLFPQAMVALTEWFRVLKPGGRLFIELPNYRKSVQMSMSSNREEAELGFVGVFGWIHDVCPDGKFDQLNVFQLHKHGWTPESLCQALMDVGFSSAAEEEVTQTERRAYKYRRDMRIVGVK